MVGAGAAEGSVATAPLLLGLRMTVAAAAMALLAFLASPLRVVDAGIGASFLLLALVLTCTYFVLPSRASGRHDDTAERPRNWIRK